MDLELPREMMLQLRNDLKDRLIREHHEHRLAARLYRKIGRESNARYEDRQASDKLRMAQAIDDPTSDLTHLSE